MKARTGDPFEVLVLERESDDFAELAGKPVQAPALQLPGAVTARLHGFDLDERPLLTGVPGLPNEIVEARTTVALSSAEVGCLVIVLFERSEVHLPIVVGVLRAGQSSAPATPLTVDQSDQQVQITAEREIVLRCGEASITLTRAGKVIIQGNYVVSRSKGVNKIKGAAVDIN